METLRNKSLGFYIKLAIVAILIITIVNIIIRYGLVSITPQSASSSNISIEVFNKDKQKVNDFNLTPGKSRLLLLPRAQYELRASQGYSQSLTTFEIGFLQKTDVNVTLQAEKEVIKSGSESMGCGSTIGGVYFSYKCEGQSYIFKHSTLSSDKFSEKTPLDSNILFDEVKAYTNGFLAISYGDEEYELRFMNASNNQAIVVPQPNQELKTPTVFINNDPSPSGYSFGLVDVENKKVALYRSITDTTPLFIDFDRTSVINKESLVMGFPQISGESLYVYFHPQLRQGDIGVEDEEAMTDNDKPGQLVEYSLSDKKITKQLEVPAKYQIFSVYRVGESYLAETTASAVAPLRENKTSLELLGGFPDSNNIVVVNNIAYFNKSNEIYSYNPKEKTAYRIFSSDQLNISRLSNTSNQILFTAFSQNTPDIALPEAYEVNLNKSAAYPRSEWTLPYDDTDVKRMDYNESLILVSLSLNTLGWDRQTGQPFLDQAEFNTKKQRVLKKIKGDGLDKGRSINFIY